MYSSEAAFSRALVPMLRKKCSFVQRIESATTGTGIPDIYAVINKKSVWIELKNDPRLTVRASSWKIDWRKGQQAWAQRYLKASGQCMLTIVACRDGFLMIPMTRVFNKNIISCMDALIYKNAALMLDILWSL